VITGSFNFAPAGQHHNVENLFVIHAALAA
jgi:hypothetical protein